MDVVEVTLVRLAEVAPKLVEKKLVVEVEFVKTAVEGVTDPIATPSTVPLVITAERFWIVEVVTVEVVKAAANGVVKPTVMPLIVPPVSVAFEDTTGPFCVTPVSVVVPEPNFRGQSKMTAQMTKIAASPQDQRSLGFFIF